MPPKKGENKEQLQAVEYNIKTISVQYQLQGLPSVDLVNLESPEYQDLLEIISRQDIIEAAREKGLYIDLNNLSEKEKNNKNFKPDPTKTELNSEIMAGAFLALMEDKEMAIKKAKKDQQDSKKPKVDLKQKKKELESTMQPEEEEEKEPEGLDKVYFLNDFPNADELDRIQSSLQIDCFIMAEQEKGKDNQVDMSILDQLHMTQQQIKEKLNKFIEEHQQDNIDDTHDICTSIDRLQAIKMYIQEQQKQGTKIDRIDKQVITTNGLGGILIKIGTQYVQQLKAYEEYQKKSQVVPLVQSHIDIDSIRNQWKQNNYYYRKISQQNDQGYLERILDGLMYQVSMEQYQTQTQNVRQFDNTDDESFIEQILNGAGDALLKDRLAVTQAKTQLRSDSHVFPFLARLQTFPGQHDLEQEQDKEVDKIRAQEQITQVRVHMPQQDYNQQQILQRFVDMMGTQVQERQFQFQDRIYRESLNRGQLRDRMHQLEMQEMDTCYWHDAKQGALYVAMYAYNPPGRVLHRYFSYKHNVMPSLALYRHRQEQYDRQDTLYSLDQLEVAKEDQQIMYPDDRSILRVSHTTLGHNGQASAYKCMVRVEEGHTMGIKHNMFYYQFHGGLRLNYSIRQGQPRLDVVVHDLIVSFHSGGQVEQQRILEYNEQDNRQYPQMVTRQQFIQRRGSEKRRTIDSKGKVRKFMADGSVEIFTPKGQIYENKKNGVWIITYQDGSRWVYNQKSKERRKLGGIDSQTRYDIEEGKRVIIRKERSAFSEEEQSGRMVSRFYDGTIIDSDRINRLVTISHPDYRTVSLEYDEVKQRMGSVIGQGSSFASIGYNHLMERSYSGLIFKTLLDQQGSHILHYQEKHQLGAGQTIIQWIHLFYSHDGSLMKFSQDGQVLYLGHHARTRIEAGSPIDSFIQLFGVKEERKQGVYSADLHQGYIETKDGQANHFRISADGGVVANVSVSLTQGNSTKDTLPDIDNGQYVPPNNMFLPPPKEWIDPQLFVLHKDGGYQFHSQQAFQEVSSGCHDLQTENRHILYSSKQNTKPIQQILPRLIQPAQQAPVHYPTQPPTTIHYREFVQFNDLSQCPTQESLGQFQIDQIVKAKLDKYSRVQPDEKHQDEEFEVQMKIYEQRKQDSQC